MKFAYKWHRRLGWVLAPLLAISALSGSVLLWLQPFPSTERDAAPPIQIWARALELGLADVALRHPGAQVDMVDLPQSTDQPIRAHVRLPADAGGAWVSIDASRGTAGAMQHDSRDVKTVLLRLHDRLLLADAGRWALRAIALCTLVLVGMGLRVWWRARRVSTQSRWRRWHRTIGPMALAPIAMMLATGFVLSWPEMARKALSIGGSGVAAAPTLEAPGTVTQPASLGESLAAAAEALPQARPTRIYAARQGVVRVRLRAEEWNRFGLHEVYLRADPSSVLRVVRASEQPASVRYLDYVYPLHTAWLPGIPSMAASLVVRALWTMFALSLAALAISGAAQRFMRK